MNVENNQRKSMEFKGQLRLYMQWPIFAGVILAFLDLFVFQIDTKVGAVVFVCVAVYFVVIGVLYFYCKKRVMKEISKVAVKYSIVQNALLKDMTIPYAVLGRDAKTIWMNDRFAEIFGVVEDEEIYLNKYIPELNEHVFPKGDDQGSSLEVVFHGREYKAELRKLSSGELQVTQSMMEKQKKDDCLVAISLEDVTQLNSTIRAVEEQSMVAGLIYIDNYDEVIDSVEEVRQSLLMALVERKINQYLSKIDGIVRKMESDKYFIAIQKKHYKQLAEDKFSLLEDVKGVNVGNTIPATVSIGLGISKQGYAQSANFARVAIDLALARGGDQAVVKEGSEISYYGGKREQTAKNTRVKARVKAEALREFMMSKDTVFIMGHKLTDVDALGAAIGMYRAAASMNKKAYIVINEVSASLRPLYASYNNNPEYPEDLFVKPEQAEEMAEGNSMVIVVDTNRPQMTESAELLKICKTVVVLDHHRQSADNIDNAILSYIEPYASSSCEMVSEILQYISDDIKLSKLEASSLYAGMVIDTNNFMYRTGVKTFETAAFLRRCGADITLVKKMFRDDMESYQVKASIISSAEVYREKYAIARNFCSNVESPTIIGAQSANELLDINEVKASFVLTVYNDRIYVSARSIDEVNVQVIMEKIGGGGHMNAAGAQFEHTDMDEAVKTLKSVIDMMTEKGELS